MTLQILIERCFVVVYFLVVIADFAFILKICNNAINDYTTQYTTRFNKKTELPKKNKIKGFLALSIFFIPIINLICGYYLLTRTEYFYKIALEALEKRYED